MLRDTGEGYIVEAVNAARSEAARSERVVLRLGAFVLVLAAIFGVGFGLGAALGPEPDEVPEVVDEMEHGTDDTDDTDDEHDGMVHDD